MAQQKFSIIFFITIIGVCLVLFLELQATASHETQSYANQTMQYEGMMFKNKFNGPGVLVLENGDCYQGDFIEGRFEGIGVFQSHNGWQYQGDFIEGKFHGSGELKTEDGKVFRGEFVKGVFQENAD